MTLHAQVASRLQNTPTPRQSSTNVEEEKEEEKDRKKENIEIYWEASA